jgi:hypothetical protein
VQLVTLRYVGKSYENSLHVGILTVRANELSLSPAKAIESLGQPFAHAGRTQVPEQSGGFPSLRRRGRMAASELDAVAVHTDRTNLLARIRGEYLEMPGLRLTPVQARRLWGMDVTACQLLLEDLVSSRFLKRTEDGAYQRMS